MTTKRILIPDATFDGSAIREAFQMLLDVMAENKDVRRCVLYIPTKGNIQATTLQQVVGEKNAKLLRDGKEVRIGDGALRLETAKTFKSHSPGDAVIAVYADQQMMDDIDSNKALKAVVCVPHSPNAVDEWKRTWNPTILGETREDARLIDNRVVEVALTSMTKRINLGHSVLHPSDAEAVKDAFRILRAHQQTEDPANIRAWCIKNGWNPGAADEAKKHATKAFTMRSKPSGFGSQWASNIYERWVQATTDI
jgi:hypothetical protein